MDCFFGPSGCQVGIIKVGEFYIKVDAAVPGNIAAILAAVAKTGWDFSYSGGLLAARIIGCIDPGVKPILFNAGALNTLLQISDVYYEISSVAFGSIAVKVSKVVQCSGRSGRSYYKEIGESLFSGGLSKFVEWATSTTGLENILHRIVEFKYNGGTTPGAIRRVYVDQVVRVDDDIIIKGNDLSKNLKINDSYRNYNASKIVGEIKII